MKELDLDEEKVKNALEPLHRELSIDKIVYVIVIVSCSLILVVGEMVFGSGGYFDDILVVILGLILAYFSWRVSKARREYVYSYKKEIARWVLEACFEKSIVGKVMATKKALFLV